MSSQTASPSTSDVALHRHRLTSDGISSSLPTETESTASVTTAETEIPRRFAAQFDETELQRLRNESSCDSVELIVNPEDANTLVVVVRGVWSQW